MWPAAGLICDQLMQAPAWYCIMTGDITQVSWGLATPHRALVTSHRGPGCRVTGCAASWSVDTLDTQLSALTCPRGILIIWPQPAVGRECLRSQLRNKHVFCKEGQITWLTLLSPQTLLHRPHVTRGYQELPAIRTHHHRCCINSAGFNAKPPLLSLFA